MDFSKNLKSLLENKDILAVIEEFKLEKEAILKSLSTNANILCSNDSFLFIFFEQSASILALSLNHLCKTKDLSYKQSFQLLQLNEAPVGNFQKCLINQAGTYILLAYEKNIYCVELPLKWGKYDQFDAGRSNIICKTIQLSPSKNSLVLDVLWHTKSEENLVVCLTSDSRIRIFRISKPQIALKEFYFSNSLEVMATKDSIVRGSEFLSLDMGTKFEYNDRIYYPIFVKRTDSVIECLLDNDSQNFDYIGPLRFKPYEEEIEQSIIESFMCLPGHPCCLVIFFSSGIVYHTVLITNTKELNDEPITSFNEDDEIEEDAVLFIYEKFSLSEKIQDFQSLKLYKDISFNSHYFIKHKNGLHSIHLKWLNELDEAFQNDNLTDFDETESCEFNNLISTNPLFKQPSSNFLLGITVIYDFGKTKRTLVCLDNQAKFICKNIEFSEQTKDSQSENKFTNYVVDLLKRETNMPLILTNLKNELSEEELIAMSKNIVNLIRNEYIERQNKIVAEFRKRNRILKSREKLQYDSIKDINNKIEKLKENKENLIQLHLKITSKQKCLESRTEELFKRLFVENKLNLNENEKKVFFELKKMHKNLKEMQDQISKKAISLNEIKEKKESQIYEENELVQMKKILKNESEKINDLIRKIEILKSTV